jgi:hypothetical protein
MPRYSPEKKAVKAVDRTLENLKQEYMNTPLDEWIYALELLREEAQTYLDAAECDRKQGH